MPDAIRASHRLQDIHRFLIEILPRVVVSEQRLGWNTANAAATMRIILLRVGGSMLVTDDIYLGNMTGLMG